MAPIRYLVAAAAIALAPACSDDDGTIIADDPVGDTTADGYDRGDAVATLVAEELTGDDELIVLGKTAGILATINDGEILQADFELQVGQEGDVVDYAARMIDHHDSANLELDDTVRLIGVGYEASAAQEQLLFEAQQGLGVLRAAPPGEVDFAYIEMQVVMHAETQVILDELAVQNGDPYMLDYIANTRAMVDDHLAEAQDILETYY